MINCLCNTLLLKVTVSLSTIKDRMNNLVWFRNDLRTQDNNSLYKATKNAGKTLAVYCLDPRQFEENKHGFKKTEKFRAIGCTILELTMIQEIERITLNANLKSTIL